MNAKRKSISRLGDALFSTTQQRVPGLLYGRPGETCFVNQILRLAGMDGHTIKRELDRMTAVGMQSARWRVLDRCHQPRNCIECEGVGEIDDRLLAELTDIERELLTQTASLGPID